MIVCSTQELFSYIDVDHSGYINIKELIMYLDSVADEGVDENEVREIFNRLDVTGDRNIDYWEFEVLPLCLLVWYIVEFLFVHSFSCQKTQNACISVLSGVYGFQFYYYVCPIMIRR